MNITVLGAGAMGCVFGGRLAEAGHRVELVDVRAVQIDAIRRDGLTIEADDGVRTVRLAARLADAAPSGPAELVLLFTKAHHSAVALAAAAGVLGPDTWVLTLQNGLGVVDHVRERIDPQRIIVGVTTVPSDLVAPGRVRTRGTGTTKIMAVAGGIGDRLREIAAGLHAAGLACEIAEDVWAAIWEKLAFNAALNALTAVTGLTVGQLGAAPDGRWLADTVAGEVVAVAQRKGIAADLASVRATISMAFRDHGDHQPSMLQDVLARRATEIDYVDGAVVREATALGMEVPVTATLWRLVRLLEHSYQPGDRDNV
jgi:2-dehydropantoate 2-reductase